ncbi:MAG: tetratricopeptide repeat protein [Bacteroidales bacterium]|nr:tetratricopeptide repeat protein [Bacteroidales bacterium]
MKHIFLFFFGIISLDIAAQTINQPGEVRTISYEQGKKGAPVADVRIKSKGLNEVRSTADGKFILPVKAEGGNIFTFEDVSRAGYEPVVPSREEFLSRKFAINPASGVTLILASNDQLFAERRRIEQKIRLEKEQEIADRESEILKLQAEVNKLQQLSENITDLTAKLTRMEEELQKFKDSYYSSDDLIRQEAQRLSKIDFQTIDSVQAVIVNLLKEGKGGEVVTIARNQLSADLWNKIMNDPGSIKRDMEQKRVELKQDSLLLDQAARQLKNMADGFAAKYQNDSAAFYLKKRMELDLNNYENIDEYALYITNYLASYDEALDYYLEIQTLFQKMQYHEYHVIATIIHNTGYVYSNMGNIDKAMEYYQQGLTLRTQIYESEHPDIACSYNNIGYLYDELGDYPQALKYHFLALGIGKLRRSSRCCLEHGDAQGDIVKSLDYYQKSLSIKEKAFNIFHPDVALAYHNIGNIYDTQGEYQKALEYLFIAEEIREKTLGFNHPDLAATYNNIAHVYSAQGYYEKATSFISKV